MVDVWTELGKAVGRALKPLADMGAAIWRAFGEATGDLIKGFIGAAEDLGEQAKPVIESMMPSIFDEATAALGEESPPKEVKEAVDKMVKQLMAMIDKESKTEGKSPPELKDLLGRQAALVGGVVTLYAVTHAVSMALDASHIFKEWGFKSAVMDTLYQFDMSKVIGPMIQAPIWASVITPLRMRMNEAYPYQVPGTGVLPYLRAKNIITEEEYLANMKFGALDVTWSAALLQNTARYPSFSELRTMIHRGQLTTDAAKIALEKSLMHQDYIDGFEAMVPSIPSISDLVRFAVREAYPDAETFEEQYAKMSEWLARQGYSQYFSDAIWASHWIIPTISQADEMLHRGDVTEEEHTALYILNDIRPKDIDRLRALTWKLPGRIESRWMFRWGEIDAGDLRDLLIKDGLDPVHADSVAMAMAKNQFLTDINRQVFNVKADYVKGYSVEATLRADLAVLGLRSEIVEYHVVDALGDRTRAMHDEELRTLRSQYARGAMPMADIILKVETIIIDEVAREAWLAALPTAKQVVIMEETYGAEVNRLVVNAKYDYVRGYTLKSNMVSRLELLDLPTEVIEFHVMDADEDRGRRHKDKSLALIEEGYVDDLIEWVDVEAMAKEILVDEAGLKLYLDGVWLNKHKAVRVFAGE